MSKSTKKAPVLEIRNLFKHFPATGWVVEDTSLTVEQGELLYVLGPSGSGKTTLLRLICGFEAPDGGEIVQGGRLISAPGWVLPPEQRRIGMVFQDYAIFPHLTVRENVGFGLLPSPRERVSTWLRGRFSRRRRKQALYATQRLEHKLKKMFVLVGLKGLEQRYPHQLSGGQQQRVALARSLAMSPQLILLDEPFSNLDTHLRIRIREEVRAVLTQSGATSILVTHDREEAINLAGRIAVMNQGRVEQVGSAEELLHAPKTRFVASFIGMSGFIRGRVNGSRVETELGTHPLPPGMERPHSTQVDVLLRPDHLRPSRTGTRVRVRKTDFIGVQSLYTLILPSGTEIQALFPGHPHLSPGDAISIRFDPPQLVLFRPEEDRQE